MKGTNMDASGFRDRIIDAVEYMAFYKRDACTFNKPIEVEWGMNGEKKKVIPTICFVETYEKED